jgi:hypothetical protein
MEFQCSIAITRLGVYRREITEVHESTMICKFASVMESDRHHACSTLENRDEQTDFAKRRQCMLSTILIIILRMMLLGAVPTWPYSRSWGYYPAGGLGLVLLIVLLLVLLGAI